MNRKSEIGAGGAAIYGTFLLGEDEYAIEMDGLQEVVDAPKSVQRMPLSPPFLAGIFPFRGRILPVVELAELLQTASAQKVETGPRRMAVIRKDSARLGILFDRLGEVLRVRPQDLTQLQRTDSGIPVKAVIYRRDSGRVIQVLDFDALLSIRNLPAVGEANGSDDESSQALSNRMRDLYRDKLIGFMLGGCRLAVEMRWVHSILRNVPRQSSPRKSPLCDSVVEIRGGLAPVIKTARLFRLEEKECSTLLVASIGNELITFEVDEVTSIIPYSQERIIPIPVLDDYRAPVFRGCFTDRDGKEFIVLNEKALLTRSEIEAISVGHRGILGKQELEEEKSKAVKRTSVLTFRLGRVYGLPLSNVVEVLMWPETLVRTPDIPQAVMGMINLRGQPLPVIDPRALFPLEPEESDSSARIILVQHEGRKLGMRVDSLDSIISVATDSSQDMPDLFFRKDMERFQDGFERAVKARTKSKEDGAVVLLHADQLIGKLAAVLSERPEIVAEEPVAA